MKLPNIRKGFTLIELLVVISIIGVISGFLLVSLGGVQKAARDSQRKAQIAQYQQALETVANAQGGTYPTTTASITASFCDTYLGSSISGCPQDPRNADDATFVYSYSSDGARYVVWAKLENSAGFWVTCSDGSKGFAAPDVTITNGGCPVISDTAIADGGGASPTPGGGGTPLPTGTPAPPGPPAPPPGTNFSANADTYVGAEWPDTNFGVFSNLDVMSFSSNRRSFVKFDLSTIPAGSTINSATLSLYAYEMSPSRSYGAYRVLGSWAENSLTWENQPSISSTATSTATVPSLEGYVNWSVASDVQAWVSGTANNGFTIKDTAESNSSPLLSRFRSREYGTASRRPVLNISYIAATPSPPPPPPAPIPSPPTSLVATCPSPGTSATLDWADASGAMHYQVRVDVGSDSWWSGDQTPSNYSFSSTAGSTYSWRVHSCNASGCSGATIGTNFTCVASALCGATTTAQKRVFVTSTDYRGGDVSGLSSADTKCTERANAANLCGGTVCAPFSWKAWLSNSTSSPALRFTKSSGNYVSMQGDIIANGWCDLTDGILDESFYKDEFGSDRSAFAWTGTVFDGTGSGPSSYCSDWASSVSGAGRFGVIGVTSSSWTNSGSNPCVERSRLYCFEQ